MIALKKAQMRERHFPNDGCFFNGLIDYYGRIIGKVTPDNGYRFPPDC